MELENSTPKAIPAETNPTGTDKEGQSCQEKWSYASVVEMMMYLTSNLRPDIAFAVHQCARFTHNPKALHEKALKQIARYLTGTRHQGMVIKPSHNL